MVIGLVDRARWIDPDKALRKVLGQIDIEDAHSEDAWGLGLGNMLAETGGKEVEYSYMNWLGRKKEWLAEQLLELKRDEKKEATFQQQLIEEDTDKAFKAAIDELGHLDKTFAKLEAKHLAKRGKKLATPDKEVVEFAEKTRRRRTDSKPCTATTNLSHGSAISKMKLL